MEQIKNKWVNGFIIGTFVSLYLLVSIISTIHVIDFFELSNPKWLAISLAIGFELGAAASLAAIITLDKMNKTLVWALFLVITAMQMQGNMYYAFINMGDFTTWSELFNLIEEEPLYQKRVLSFVSGAILPLVALGFIKSLVDYIKPSDDSPVLNEDSIEKKTKVDSGWKSEDILDKPTSTAPAHTEGMLDDDIKAWQDVGEKLAEEVEDEWDEDHALDMVMNDMVKDLEEDEIDSLPDEARVFNPPPRMDILEKQQQTNIPAKGLINKPTETTSITLEGGRGNTQRKIKEVRNSNNK